MIIFLIAVRRTYKYREVCVCIDLNKKINYTTFIELINNYDLTDLGPIYVVSGT